MSEPTPERTLELERIKVIRMLGFIGNSHYCPGCLNEFHADRGQHDFDCPSLKDLMDDPEWWSA